MRLDPFLLAPVLLLFADVLAAAQKPPAHVTGGRELLHFRILGHAQSDRYGAKTAGIDDINGDGINDFMVSVPGWESFPDGDHGAVRVRSGADRALIYQYHGTTDDAHLGNEIAGVGDLDADGTPDFAISSGKVEYPSGNEGIVYAYSGATGALIHSFYGGAYESFGDSVTGVGDVNLDGHDDLLVGAPGRRGFASSFGSAYLFSGMDGSQLAYYSGPTNSQFGASVACLGDMTGDGIPDFAIGAPKDSSGGRNRAGAVYLYSGATMTLVHTLHGSVQHMKFGSAVGPAGDANGDGIQDLAVGAPGARVHQASAGSFFLISGSDFTTLTRINGPTANGALGYVFDALGDVDGDGRDDMLLGYPSYDFSPPYRYYSQGDRGAAFIISGATGQAIHRFVDDQTAGQASRFGRSVARIGDIDGDGVIEFLISALNSEETHFNGGKIECYSFSPFLSMTEYRISASAGGHVDFTVDFPDINAGYPYRLLFSSHGQGPTTLGVPVPLTRDHLFRKSLAGNYSFSHHQGLTGVLDAQGNATASIGLTPGAAAHQVGQTLWVAAVTGQPGSVASRSSISYPIEIAP